jgi:hypothetical protein
LNNGQVITPVTTGVMPDEYEHSDSVL